MEKQINHFYIHFPFCTSRCGYCSFYTEQFSLIARDNFVKLLTSEIEESSLLYDFEPKTIYFGGGTPSLLFPDKLKEIIEQITDKAENCEITLECNPITLTKAYIEDLAQSGVNRVSLGIQSLQESNLKYLGRKHSPHQVAQVIKELRAQGFKNISGDLIYGIPNQRIIDIQEDIKEFLKLDLDHISIYCLSLEEDTSLFKDLKLIPEDEIVAEMYQLICDKLEESGFEQYEISNFAKANCCSKHNLAYWEQKDYLGLGAGAYGTIANLRYNNSSFSEWEMDVKNKRLFPNREYLTERDKMNEYIMLQLRLNKGLSTEQLKIKYNFDIWAEKKELILSFLESNLIEKEEERLCLTYKSRFISNYIISELMEDK